MLQEKGKKNLFKPDMQVLAKIIGKSRTHTSLVWHGHRVSEPTRKLIAEALGVKVEDLWPNNNHDKAA